MFGDEKGLIFHGGIEMISSERRMYIMNQLSKKGVVNLKEIARELNISEITVRRDFEKLEQAGKLKRVQGGAALENVLDNAELTMKEKQTLHAREKAAVANHVAGFVKDGDCIFIDGGTSMIPVVAGLHNMKVNIVTYNDLAIRSLINSTASIIVIGGLYLPHYGMNVGPMAQEQLKQFHFNIGFFGCAGIDVSTGYSYTTDMESLLIKKIAMENCRYKVLLIDSSKMNQRSFLKFEELSAFDKIVCNDTGDTGIILGNLELV